MVPDTVQLMVLVAGFSLASPSFLRTDNIISILQATSVNGVLAVGVTLIIITGGIDLSIGTLMTFCAVMSGVVLTWLGAPLPAGVVVAIATGALELFGDRYSPGQIELSAELARGMAVSAILRTPEANRDFINRLIDRAKAVGCSALVLTLDLHGQIQYANAAATRALIDAVRSKPAPDAAPAAWTGRSSWCAGSAPRCWCR